MANLQVHVATSFDDPRVDRCCWNRLLAQGPINAVNLTWEWQRNWWNHFGRGKLLLVCIERDSEPVAIAPLFAHDGMVFNICPEDRLDIVGGADSPEVLETIVSTVLECVDRFQGMRLYFIPDSSSTHSHLQQAAQRLGLDSFEETWIKSPRLDIAARPEAASACIRKKSLVRHENYFRREGRLDVRHFTTAAAIIPHLSEFFGQHVTRRAATVHTSIFEQAVQRDYYRRIVEAIGPTGWLRFTRLDWNGDAIAFHFGLCYEGRYLFGIPSFAIHLRRRSPGEVLLRQLIQAAVDEAADVFDFGIGDEPYKYRFATSDERLVTWGLYLKQSLSVARHVR